MTLENKQLYFQEELGQMDRWGGLPKGTSEKVMGEYEKKRIEPLSGIETAKKISMIYDLLGPKLGSRLVEPNVVLCVAGIKGIADIPWIELEKPDFEKLEKTKARLIESGIFFSYAEDSKGAIGEKAVPVLMSIENVRGIERKTKTTRIPGVPVYDSRSDEEKQRKSLWESLEEAKQEGKIQKEVNLQIIVEGILLGYPDQAILDFERCLQKGDIHTDLVEADIISAHPKAQEIDGAVPEFDYYPEHKDDPEIIEYIKNARQILKDFYNSDWFREIYKEDDFLAGRKKYREAFIRGTAHFGH